jgi:hypothetical protein
LPLLVQLHYENLRGKKPSACVPCQALRLWPGPARLPDADDDDAASRVRGREVDVQRMFIGIAVPVWCPLEIQIKLFGHVRNVLPDVFSHQLV